MKRLLFFLVLFLPSMVYATNVVTIIAYGSGADAMTAQKRAVRSAYEQTYEAFISPNSKIPDDKLMSDDIFQQGITDPNTTFVLSIVNASNGHWYYTINANVNIDRLAKYVKGESTSLDLDMNSLNSRILLEKLQQNAEKKVIEQLIADIESMNYLWDYSIEENEPDVRSSECIISGTVNVLYTERTKDAIVLLRGTLAALDLRTKKWEHGVEAKLREHKYILYNSSFGMSVVLRDQYSNGLFGNSYVSYDNYYKTHRGDFSNWYDFFYIEPFMRNGESNSLFLSKIKFQIDPLNLKTSGKNFSIGRCHSYEEKKSILLASSDGFSGVVYCCSEIGYIYSLDAEPGDVFCEIHFEKRVSMEEAIKIKKLSVQALEKADQTEKAEYEKRRKTEQPIVTYADLWPSYEEKVKKEAEAEEEQQIFTVVENDPEFPGGKEALYKYLRDNIRYPQVALKNNISGTVYVTFVVEQDGSITNPRVLRGIGGGCDHEAVRLVKSMPKWIPGKQRGKPVRVRFNLPIRFFPS